MPQIHGSSRHSRKREVCLASLRPSLARDWMCSETKTVLTSLIFLGMYQTVQMINTLPKISFGYIVLQRDSKLTRDLLLQLIIRIKMKMNMFMFTSQSRLKHWKQMAFTIFILLIAKLVYYSILIGNRELRLPKKMNINTKVCMMNYEKYQTTLAPFIFIYFDI